jgi:hypothetical protein
MFRKLSTLLMTNTPKRRRTIPFNKAPKTINRRAAGTQMRAVPTIRMKERKAIAVRPIG